MDVKGKAKKFILGAALVLGLGNPQGQAVAKSSPKAKTELSATKKATQSKKTDFSAITLNKYSDIEKLFDMSLNIIFAELILEEVPMPNTYDDGGQFKKKKNTRGVGSTYSTLSIKDWNNPNAKWYHVAANQKAFAASKTTNEDMLKLVIGWGKYRQYTQNPYTKKFEKHETVLKRMFNRLKGCSFRPNEFSALFCAVYNNENNISYLCPLIKKNRANPADCANYIMDWWKHGKRNSGLKERCKLEVAVYLNPDDFCGAMLDMQTKPSCRASCIYADGLNSKHLTNENYKAWVNDAKKKYSGR